MLITADLVFDVLRQLGLRESRTKLHEPLTFINTRQGQLHTSDLTSDLYKHKTRSITLHTYIHTLHTYLTYFNQSSNRNGQNRRIPDPTIAAMASASAGVIHCVRGSQV